MELLTRSDIVGQQEYEGARDDFRRRIIRQKDTRRVAVGDHCSFLFENRDTMRYQVQEMLRTEESWNRQGALEDELEAYNALVPRPGELSATMMLEYETPEERAEMLPQFVGIDRHVHLHIGDVPPSSALFDRGQIDEHKVSSVQYIKFKLSDEQMHLLETDGVVVRLVIDHPAYKAQAVLAEMTRKAIAGDCR